ncbi:MAG: glycerophosphoryl diester phosphodiesterase membrane domain-containing protein [Novosphingobium sp.]|nr:glycerophosphoryl diester phosphodiesterase membrane domain-containing protein [Novosphingobium sp.]
MHTKDGTMKLDGGLVWRDANAMVTANREVLAVLAGVFFLLPSLAFSLFMPQPEPPAGADVKQLMAMMREFYVDAAPWFLGMTLIQTVGQVAVLALLARAGQATVGEALREGVAGLLPFLAVQILLVMAATLALGIAIALGGVTGSPVIAGVLVGVILGAGAWAGLRMMLTLPVIAVERKRSPFQVIRRSWELTRGNAGRILLYVALLAIAVFFIIAVAGAIIGIVMALLAGPQAAQIANAVIGAVVGSVFSLYLVASLSAMHRQLGGSGVAEETFS